MNASLPTSQFYHPGCFSDASQYQQWRAYASKARAGDSDYCTDCTRAYQHQMIKQCRCLHVKTRFTIDCDGFVEGRRLLEERLVNCKQKGRR
jgi:hypothetical protein